MFTARYAVPMAAMLVWLAPVRAGDLNPAALSYKLPAQIPWVENKAGGKRAKLFWPADPNNLGSTWSFTKWYAHHNSRPHFHPNDGSLQSLSGTCGG